MSSNKTILLLIYGIGRSTQETNSSINSFVDRLRLLTSDLRIIYFLSKQDVVNSIRTNEFGKFAKDSKKIFNEDLRYEENIDSKDYQEILDYLKLNSIDMHNDNFYSYENLLKQLTMIKRLYDKCDISSFTYVMCLRDDILIDVNTKIIELILNVKEFEVVTSSYYWNKGVCDRFLFLKSSIAKYFMNRIEYIVDYTKNGGLLTGERLLKHIIDINSFRVVSYPIRLTRVRLNGVFVSERHSLPFWNPMDLFRVLKSKAGL